MLQFFTSIYLWYLRFWNHNTLTSNTNLEYFLLSIECWGWMEKIFLCHLYLLSHPLPHLHHLSIALAQHLHFHHHNRFYNYLSDPCLGVLHLRTCLSFPDLKRILNDQMKDFLKFGIQLFKESCIIIRLFWCCLYLLHHSCILVQQFDSI